MIPYISLRVDLHSCVEDPEDFIDWLRMRLVYSLKPQTESDIEVSIEESAGWDPDTGL
jgi:hypothetical protein